MAEAQRKLQSKELLIRKKSLLAIATSEAEVSTPDFESTLKPSHSAYKNRREGLEDSDRNRRQEKRRKRNQNYQRGEERRGESNASPPMDPSFKNYQDFKPQFDWLHHPDSHVLIVHLQGFRSSHLKVQVTSTGKLRISGERRLDSGKWLRFREEIDVPTDADTDKISAKLEEGILYVKQPKKLSAASSTNPPEQATSMPKPKPESQSPPAAGKPKGDPQPLPEPPKPAAGKPKADPQSLAEPLKPAAGRPTVDPPTVRPNAPKSQNERRQSQPSKKQSPTSPEPQEPLKLPADPPTVRQNTPQSQNEKPQAPANGKQIPPPQEKTEKQTEEEKAKAHTNLKEALEKTRDEEGEKEGIGSKMEEEEKGKGKEEEGSHEREEKEGEVAEERRRRRRRRKRIEEMMEESGRWRRREGYKQVIDGVVKELRTNMVTLVLGIAVFVIVYLKLTKKGHVDEEL